MEKFWGIVNTLLPWFALIFTVATLSALAMRGLLRFKQYIDRRDGRE